MAQPTRREKRFDELYREIEALPQGVTGVILQPGVLTTMSRPGRRHERAGHVLLHHLVRYDLTVGGKGWWILHEYEVRFPGDRLAVPDIAGWRVDRVPKLPSENPLRILPDWACEILSPSTAKDDRLLKLPLYASAGVRWVWLVDPDLHTVEIYETVDGRPSFIAGAREDEGAKLPPFDDEAMQLGDWWMPEETA